MHFIKEIQSYQPRCEQEKNDRKLMLDMIAQFSEKLLFRDNAFAHITSSGFILNPSLDKVLLVHHHIYQTWSWTGGHADGNADLLAVACKEAAEETGIQKAKPLTGQLDSLDILPVYGHYKKGKYISAHLHLSAAYLLIADERQLLTVNEAENSAVRWCEADKLPDYSNEPYLLRIYTKLIEKARNYC